MKGYVLERFAGELARELEAWPPPFVEWVSEELRARWAAGAAERPRDDVLRFALEISRLDLARDFEGVERRLSEGAHRLQTPAEEAALAPPRAARHGEVPRPQGVRGGRTASGARTSPRCSTTWSAGSSA